MAVTITVDLSDLAAVSFPQPGITAGTAPGWSWGSKPSWSWGQPPDVDMTTVPPTWKAGGTPPGFTDSGTKPGFVAPAGTPPQISWPTPQAVIDSVLAALQASAWNIKIQLT